MNLEQINLSYNPFKDVSPNIDDTHMVWASMGEVKAKLERSYKDCINNNSKQIILNWGQYGGGKTFSAYYFSKQMSDVDNIKHIYLRCPKDGAKATDEFFISIIDALGFEELNQHIHKLITEVGEDALIAYLTPRATREFAKAICLIGSQEPDTREMMNRFLFSGISKAELKKLGLAKDIYTDSDSGRFLSGILSCYTGTNAINNGRVVIWLDEMEDLIYYAPKNYKAFSQILRDLFDNISDRFLFFLNFTLAEGEESVIELMLGAALWSRVTKKIRYKEFSEANALEYANELLAVARINKNIESPLSPEILNILISNIPINILTPREINKHINSLLSYSMEHELSTITLEVFNNWSKEYSEDF